MDNIDSILKQETSTGGNSYTPYIVIEDNSNAIHLTVSSVRKVLFVFLYKLLPLFLICMIPVLFYFDDGHIPFGFMLLVAACALAIAMLLFFNRMIHEVTITGKDVEVVSERAFKKSTRLIQVQNASNIYLQVVYGRGGGAFFELKMKDCTRVQFINIPMLFMKRKNIGLICTRLTAMTQLMIEGNYIAKGIINK